MLIPVARVTGSCRRSGSGRRHLANTERPFSDLLTVFFPAYLKNRSGRHNETDISKAIQVRVLTDSLSTSLRATTSLICSELEIFDRPMAPVKKLIASALCNAGRMRGDPLRYPSTARTCRYIVMNSVVAAITL